MPPRRNSPGIFTCGFADRANVLLPRHHTLSQPIALGLIAPDATPKIMRTRAHIKPVTLAALFFGLEIIQIHHQYTFGWFKIISAPWNLAC